MLDQLTKHSEIDLTIKCFGDLKVDAHHTIEDVGLVLGQAFDEALGERRGISRFAFDRVLPMDEAKAEVALDLSGRPFLQFSSMPMREFAGDFPTDMLEHFLRSFSQKAGITLHVTVTGQNTHHMVEAVFKALGRCLRDAVKVEHDRVSSTKGSL
jgi:imidazoleglycerol phosphate dehydratase HisB